MSDSWCDISQYNIYATALYFFDNNDVPNCLKTKPGDKIYLLMEYQSWYCGYISGYRDDIGIIPQRYVYVNPSAKLYTGESENYALYIETSDRLKEYLVNILRDFRASRMKRYREAIPYINDIINERRNLVHGTLINEKNESRKLLVKLMDKLDDLLEMDKIVRDNNLMKMDFDYYSAVELFYKYATPHEQEENFGGHLPILFNEDNISTTLDRQRSGSLSYDDQLSLKIPNFYIEISKPDFIVDMTYHFLFSICTGEKPFQYLTDRVGFEFKSGKVINELNKDGYNCLSALFYNLRASDMFRKPVLLSTIHRSGHIIGDKKDHNGKRLVCAGAISLDEFIDNIKENDINEDITLNYYSVPNSETCEIEEYLISKPLKTVIYHISLKIKYLYGSLSFLKREYPALFTSTTMLIRPTEFPEIITPESNKHRCDLFVRLKECLIEKSQQGSKLNVSVQVSVHNTDGIIIPNCIYQSDNDYPVTHYDSSVTMHTNNPYFSDIFRLSLSDKAMENSHILFLFNHLPTKIEKSPTIVGYTVFKITDSSTDAIINDGKHELYIYKHDTNDIINSKTYLKHIYNHDHDIFGGKNISSIGNRDYFIIETKLVATNLTTNPNIQALLHYKKRWKMQDYSTVFEQLTYVSDPETLRFGSYLLVSAINLTELISIDFSKPLTIILRILALLSDKKRSHFKNILLEQAHEINAPGFNNKFYDCIISKLDDCENKNTRILIKAFLKSLPLLIYIMNICPKYDNECGGSNSSTNSNIHIGSLIYDLLIKLCERFRDLDNKVFVLKIEMITILPHILNEYKDLFTMDQLFTLLEKLFINSLYSTTHDSNNTLTQQLNLMKFGEKLLCNLISCNNFIDNELYRNRMVTFVFEQLNIYKNISGLISHYFNPLIHLVHYLEKEAFINNNNKHIEMKLTILNHIYDYISNEQIYDNKSAKIVSLSVVIAFFRMLNTDEFIIYHEYHSNEEKLKYILILVKFSRYILLDNVIPKNNFVTSIICSNVIVKIFSCCCQLLFLDNSLIFHKNTCLKMLKLALYLLRFPSLQLELFLNERRERILKVYGDSRITVISWLSLLWDKLGTKRSLFYDEFLNKFIQVTMIDNPIVRSESLKLIGNTIEKISFDKNALKIAVNVIIDAFDAYLENCPNIYNYIDYFMKETEKLTNQIDNEEYRENYIQATIQLNNTLSQLADYSYAGDDTCVIIRDICIFKNACYFKSIQRFDLFARNIHKLANHQIAQESWLEAGCTIMEHANQLSWTDNILPATNIFPEEMEYERKASIMSHAIDLISYGKEYDRCIKISKDLYHIYDNIFVDYDATSKLLTQMASFYHSVMHDIRYEPEYFWVGFYGKDFHHSIRNKEFIHRGKNFLKLGDLIKTLKNNFPYAEVSGSSKEIDDKLKNSNQQIIFCSGVRAIPMENNDLMMNKYADEKVKCYYYRNECIHFSRQRPIIATEDVKNKWVEELTFTTEFTLPGPLDWAYIVTTDIRKVSPIEIAISDVLKKSQSLSLCINNIEKSSTNNISQLSSILNGIIDSAVNGGTSKYVEAFLVPSYLKEYPAYGNYVNQLKNALIDQYHITSTGLELHENIADPKFYALHHKMVTMFEKVKDLLESSCDITLEKFETRISLSTMNSDMISDITNQPPIDNRSNRQSVSYSSKNLKQAKDNPLDFHNQIATSNIDNRQKSGSISSTIENNENDSNYLMRIKHKSDTKIRSIASNIGYGSVSRRIKKSSHYSPTDPKSLQNLFHDPHDEKLNYTGPFILEDLENNNITQKYESKSTANVNSSELYSGTISRSKNRFRFRIDKKRSRSKSQHQDDHN